MSQTILNVKLYAEGTENDILSFEFAEGEEKVNLNTDSCQEQMKKIFSRIIRICLDNDLKIKLIIDKDYSRILYKEVCSDYIQELQKEIDSVKGKIRREIL